MTNTNQTMSPDEMLAVLSLSPNPTAIYCGEDIIMLMVNDAMLAIMGKDKSIIGKPMAEALPELIEQPFIGILQAVWRTGITYRAAGVPAQLMFDGTLKTFYFDFEYKAVPSNEGNTKCILHTAIEVGERMNKEAAIAFNEKRLKNLNADLTRDNTALTTDNKALILDNFFLTDGNASLTSANDTLTAGNTDLQGKNEMLQIAKDELQEINNRIVISENRFRAITDSPDIYISLLDEHLNRFYVNEAYQRLTGRSPEEFNKLGFEGLLHPEDGDKAQFAFMEAHKTGSVYQGEFRLKAKDGMYHTLSTKVPRVYDAAGNFKGYVSCAIDVTEQKILAEKQQSLNEELQAVNEEYQVTNEELQTANEELNSAYEESQTLNEELQTTNEEMQLIQQKLSQTNAIVTESEERFRLAIEASRLATWYMNVETREFFPSQKLRDFFGFYEKDEVTYKTILNCVRDDHRLLVVSAMNEALATDNIYDIEFPITGFRDGKLRWAHATGKVFKILGQNGKTFFGAIDDITERKGDEQRKNDFIGMVSHELKTPLVSLGGYIQILKNEAIEKENERSRELLSKANRQVEKMTAMVDSFLNMSRLESGRIEIKNTLFDMADLMKESGEESLSLYKNHSIVYHPVEPMPVNADRDKIVQVINNLISNATKYSPPGSLINVSCITVGSMAKVGVADQGIGIPQSEIPKLFDRYYRVVNKNTQSIAGFGLGLYVSAEIISRHGGVIWADSEEGKGSTFYFTLPIVK